MIEKKEKKDKKEAGLEINILPLLLFLLKKLWLIILVGLVTALLTFTAVKVLVQPTYRCSFTAYINNRHASAAPNSDYLSISDVNAAKELVKTYSSILTSNTVLSKAIDTMNANYSVKSLKKMVTTQIQDETEIIQVYAVAKSPEESYRIASAVAGVAPKIMADIVEGSSMKIVEYPQVPDSIYKPNYFKFSLIGFGAGCLLTAIVLVILYLSNDTITDETEIESRFSVPVLGIIPDTHSSASGKSGYYYNYYYQSKDHDKEKNKDKDKDRGDKQVEKA